MKRYRVIAAVLACALAVALLPGATATGADAAWTVTPLTSDDMDDRAPQVSGDRVAWEGYDGNDYEIYTWTPSGGKRNVSNHNALPDQWAQVSGDRIVWQGWDSNDWEIYTWTPGGGTTNISNHDGRADEHPRVSGDRVVWHGYDDNGDLEIYTWTPGGTSNISNRDGLDDHDPRVSGDRVVWCGYDGNDDEVYTWTPGGVKTNISERDAADWTPDVSGDRVVWFDYDGADNEVYTWIPGGGATNISNHLGLDAYPQVSGDRVVWHGDDANDREIYTWTPGGVKTNISNHDGLDDYLPRISGDRVVWEGYDGNDEEIYAWTPSGGTSNVSNRDGRGDTQPQVSGDRVVWLGFDGTDWEVFTAVPAGLTVNSISGANRYATSVEVSKKAFPDGADWVVIATGENWPDALGGASLAGAVDGPILLTRKGALPAEVAAEITRLKADKAYVLGSTAAVSVSVESALKGMLGVSDVTRLGGANRYETARLIAAETVKVLKAGPGYDGTAFVATGANFPDALGASPLAAAKGWLVFLVNPASGADGALVSAMKTQGVTKALVLGDAKAVSETTRNNLASTVPCATQRLSGANRYDTAVAVANHGILHAGLHWNQLAIATGQNFPDALSGGVLQGRSASVLLLTPSTTLNTTVTNTLKLNKATIHEVRFLGGPTAVSNAVRTAVTNALK